MAPLAAVGSQVHLFVGLSLNCSLLGRIPKKKKNQLGPMCSSEENEDGLNIWGDIESTQEFSLQASPLYI